MDKQEYREIVGDIKRAYDKKEYDKVLMYADELDLRRVSDSRVLEMISEAYSAGGDLETARDLLYKAYEKTPMGRKMAYKLSELSISLGDLDGAVGFYEDFVKMSPNDNDRYLLKYKIGKAGRVPKKELAKVLAAYCSKEVDDKWMAELASIYDEIGEKDRCNEICDDIILWYADGIYVRRALELKQKNGQLTDSQESKLEGLIIREEAEKKAAMQAAKENEERQLRKEIQEDDDLSEEDLDSILQEYITIEDATTPAEPVSRDEIANIALKKADSDEAIFEVSDEKPAEPDEAAPKVMEENDTEVIPVEVIRTAAGPEEEQEEIEEARKEAKKEAAVEAAIRKLDEKAKAEEAELFSDAFLEELDLQTIPVHDEVREKIIENLDQPEPEEVPDLLSGVTRVVPPIKTSYAERMAEPVPAPEPEYAEAEAQPEEPAAEIPEEEPVPEEIPEEAPYRAISANGRPFSNIEAMQSARTAPPKDETSFWKMPEELSMDEEPEEPEFVEPVYGSHRWFEEKTEPEFEEPVFGAHRYIPEPEIAEYPEDVQIEQVEPEFVTIESAEEDSVNEGHVPTIRTTSSGAELLGYAAAKKAGAGDVLSEKASLVRKPALGGKKMPAPELFAEPSEEPEYYEGPQYFEEEEADFVPGMAPEEQPAAREESVSGMTGVVFLSDEEESAGDRPEYEIGTESDIVEETIEEPEAKPEPVEAEPETPAEAEPDAPAEAEPETPAEAEPDAPAEEPEAVPEEETKEEARPRPFLFSVHPHEFVEEVVPDVVRERLEAEKAAAEAEKAAEEAEKKEEEKKTGEERLRFKSARAQTGEIPGFEEFLAEFDKDLEPEEEKAAEETPIFAEASVAEEVVVLPQVSPIPEEEAAFPAAEETPAFEEAPVAEEAPVFEETPVAEETFIPKETFIPEEPPVPEEEPEAEPSVFISARDFAGEPEQGKFVASISEKAIAAQEALAEEEDIPEEAQQAGFERAVQEFELSNEDEVVWEPEQTPATPEVDEAPIIEITASIPAIDEEEAPAVPEVFYPESEEIRSEPEYAEIPEDTGVPEVTGSLFADLDDIEKEIKEFDEAQRMPEEPAAFGEPAAYEEPLTVTPPEEPEAAVPELSGFEKAMLAFEQQQKEAEKETEPELSDFEKAMMAFDQAGGAEEDDFDLSELDPSLAEPEEIPAEPWQEPSFGMPDFAESEFAQPAFLGDDFAVAGKEETYEEPEYYEEPETYAEPEEETYAEPEYYAEPATPMTEYEIPDDLRDELSEFLMIGGMEEKIRSTIGNIIYYKREGDPTGGHLIVTGDAKSGKTYLTISVIKAVGKEIGSASGRVAKVQADALNGKDMNRVFGKIKGSDLIIENAGYLKDETAQNLAAAMKASAGGSMIVLEGNRLGIENLLTKNPELETLFHTRLDLSELSLSEWADLACDYAEEKGYRVGDMALLALHAKIDEINLPTTRLVKDDVEGIIDKAIEKAAKRFSGRFRGKKGREMERELDETDFM